MSEELLTRMIYGSSLALHNVFAGIPLGLAIVHCIYAFHQYMKGWEKGLLSIRLTFDLLVLSIILAVFAGFAFEIEFARFWPSFGASLDVWNRHAGHKSAVVSYFISSMLITATYYFQLWKKPILYLLASVLWIFLCWLFSVWGIFLNTVMQYPFGASIVDGVLILEGSLTELFFSNYHIVRQSHIALASVLKSCIIILLFWAYYNKTLLKDAMRFFIVILLISLAGLGVTGHFQATNIAKHQPSKFAAMEGILSPEDICNWNVIGFMGVDGQIRSIPIKGGLQVMTNSKITSLEEIPEDEQPSIAVVFNAFRIMIYSFILIFIITMFLWFRKNRMIVPMLIILLILAELAINSGWMLSESGRQPWMYYGLLKREYTEVPFIYLSLLGLVLNTVLLMVATLFSMRYLKKYSVYYFYF